MANTRTYLNHLLQNTGITPACSEEERVAAEEIARIFSDHGFAPEVQEFSASGSQRLVQGILGIAAFLGAVLMGIGGAVGIVGLLLAVAAAVLFTLERSGRPVLSNLGSGGLSQNVIAYHKASGPLASPRNRPVVVVAHYDSPRADIFSTMPYAAYRPAIAKLLPLAMLVPAIIAIVRLLPLPGAAKTVLWLVAIVVALVPLAQAVSIILNRFVLPYTSGSVCNKSSVAAMLGVMDAVAPYEGDDEFPEDVPFEEYFEEQQRIAEEQLAAAQAAANPDYADLLEQEGIIPEEDSEELVEAEEDEAEEDEADEGFAEEQGATGVMPGLGLTQAMPAIDDEDGAAADDDVAAAEDEVAETAEGDEDAPEATDAADEVEETEPEAEEPSIINEAGMYRFGTEAIRSLGMIPESCVLVYEEAPAAPKHAAPAPVEPVAAPVVPVPDADDEETLEDEELTAPAFDTFEEDYAPYEDDEDEEETGRDYEAERDALISSTHRPIRHQPIQQVGAPARGFAGLGGLAGAGGIGAALSQVGDKASRLFDTALNRGRKALEGIESTARSITGARVAEDELYEDIENSEVQNDFSDEWVDDDTLMDEGAETLDTEADTADDASFDDEDMGATQVFEPISDADEPASGEPDIDDTVVAPLDDEDASEEDVEASEDAAEDDADAEDGAAPDDEVNVYGDTQLFVMPDAAADEPTSTISMPAIPAAESAPAAPAETETVDSLMAEIAQRHPQRAAVNTVPDPAFPSINQTSAQNRASLFDLPDPSAATEDPFAPAGSSNAGSPSATTAFAVVDGTKDTPQPESDSRFETISAPAPQTARPKRGLGGLFRRKKKSDDSMADWLGVDDDFDAKTTGGKIGSWDDFEDDGDWKGGATGIQGVSERELRDAITSMGDDELLGHDIWFVATGASECGNAGMKAFLETHRDKLRGVFLINLECVGAGQLAMVATEGDQRVLKGDKRISNLVRRVSAAFHNEFASVEMPYEATDAYVAMNMSLRSLTIAGVDGPNFACSHSEADQPFNVNPDNVDLVADVVTEVIRRS